MSQLRKVIERAQRGEGPRLGFGALTREKPKGLAFGSLSRDADAARAAIDAGADFIVFRADGAAGAVDAIKAMGETKVPLGVWLSEVKPEDTEKLAEAGADFVASPLDGTVAEAVDTERLGQVLAVTGDIEETTLRSLGALGLDAMFVKRPAGQMTLQQQVELARLAVLSGMPLLVSSPADVSTGELRVLRDSGAIAVIAADGSSAEELKALNERLRAVPPRRSRGRQNDTPLIPSAGRDDHDHEHDDDED